MEIGRGWVIDFTIKVERWRRKKEKEDTLRVSIKHEKKLRERKKEGKGGGEKKKVQHSVNGKESIFSQCLLSEWRNRKWYIKR